MSQHARGQPSRIGPPTRSGLRRALIAALCAWATPAWACPLCRSEAGERVRAGLFGSEFGYNLFVTLLPFPIFLGIIAWIHFGIPKAGRRGPASRPDRAAPPPSTTETRPWTTGRTDAP